MLNPKKFAMSFKRYRKNFVDGIKFEDVKEDYDDSKSKIAEIVERNTIEKDHILLVNLKQIYSYYLSQWKNDVLIQGGNHPDGLKAMQMVVFYQCMGQDLYKIRYPKMFLRYTFKGVITALIHFTMFGWEKEEKLLFDFIVENFGGHLIDADDDNKHIWFLLELYLQYRDKTIAGTNQKLHLAVIEKIEADDLDYDYIPEDLGVYGEVLERWSTPNLEEIENLIGKMSLYHSLLASEIGKFDEFGDFGYGFYPFEIMFLIHVRNKLGLLVPTHFNDDLLMNTPEAKMMFADPEPYPEWDPLLLLIDNFYRKSYPEYIPNQHGALFQSR